MKAFGQGKIWTFDEMDQFIKAPQKHVAGTKMSFVGLKKQEDRIAMLSYLHSLGSNLPIPAPKPAAPAEAPAADDAIPTGEGTVPPGGQTQPPATATDAVPAI
jgi:cytochrome c